MVRGPLVVLESRQTLSASTLCEGSGQFFSAVALLQVSCRVVVLHGRIIRLEILLVEQLALVTLEVFFVILPICCTEERFLRLSGIFYEAK